MTARADANFNVNSSFLTNFRQCYSNWFGIEKKEAETTERMTKKKKKTNQHNTDTQTPQFKREKESFAIENNGVCCRLPSFVYRL